MPIARMYFLALATLVGIIGGCTTFHKDPITTTVDNIFLKYLTREAGYTPSPMPSSLERGGSL